MAISLIEENGEHIDWIEEDELELSDVQFNPNEDVEDIVSMPIYTLVEQLSSPPTDDE